MELSPDWVSAIAEFIFALGVAAGGLWAIYTYRESKRTNAAEWINNLFKDFYLNDRFEDIRRGLEYHYEDEIQPLIEGRLTENDRRVKPLTEEDIELLSQIDDLLNYFEHIAYLEKEGHIKAKDRDAMFEYWFELLNQPKFAAIRRYASKFGFQGIATALDSTDEEYIMIYGTLMRDYDAHEELSLTDHLTYLDECTVNGKLYDLGEYPGLILRNGMDPDPSGEQRHVTGELYRVEDESVFAEMDEFERYDPNDRENSLYVRQIVRLNDPPVDAWVYVYNRDIEDATIIESGDWRAYDS